jgi:hypothetical protein
MTARNGQRGGIGRLYSVLWTHARGMRGRMVLALALLVAAQCVRLTIPWLFGCAVNALQTRGPAGVQRAGWVWVALLAAANTARAGKPNIQAA